MRSFIPYVLSLLGAASALKLPHTDTTDSAVVSLTDTTFHRFMSHHDLALAYFYSPHCGHCRRFDPQYEKAAKVLKEFNVPLVKVDCTENIELCYTGYYINAYPTLMVFHRLEADEHILGYRDTDAYVNPWLEI